MPKLEWMLVAEQAEFAGGSFAIRGACNSFEVSEFPIRFADHHMAAMVRVERDELTEPFTDIRIELEPHGETDARTLLHEGFARVPDPKTMTTHAGHMHVIAKLPVIFFTKAGEYDLVMTINGVELGRVIFDLVEIVEPPEIYI